MRRKIFTHAPLLSLLLCVATAVFWMRSYWTTTQVTLNTTHYSRTVDEEDGTNYFLRVALDSVRINCGRFTIYRRRSPELHLGEMNLKDWQPAYPEGTSMRWENAPAVREQEWCPFVNVVNPVVAFDEMGFFHGSYSVSGMFSGSIDFRDDVTQFPAWLIVLLTAWLPALRLTRWIRNGSTRAGVCRTCRYNLTGNTSGTCPECGTPITIPT